MICENCGKEHDGTYATGRFCCQECARSFASKNTTGQLKKGTIYLLAIILSLYIKIQ